MLEVDDVGSVVRMVVARVEVRQICNDAFGIEVVNHSAVLRYFLLVEEVVRAEPVHVAHEEVGRHGVVGMMGDALAHGSAGPVGEGEADHVAVFHTVGVSMDDTLGQDEGLAASWGC